MIHVNAPKASPSDGAGEFGTFELHLYMGAVPFWFIGGESFMFK